MVECIHHRHLGSSHKGKVPAHICLKCGAKKDYPPVNTNKFGFTGLVKNGSNKVAPYSMSKIPDK